MELVVFVIAAAMILVGAIGVILRPNPVHAALSLVLTLFGVAVTGGRRCIERTASATDRIA